MGPRWWYEITRGLSGHLNVEMLIDRSGAELYAFDTRTCPRAVERSPILQ